MEKKRPIPVGCVVMAAGNAERFGANKLAAEYGGKALIERALEAVPADELAAVAVVTRYPEVEALARRRGFLCLDNDRPDLGQSRTIRLGTEALRDLCGSILYLVADQPLLRRESVAGLVRFSQEHPESIVAASHDGVRGNPCIFPSACFPELCALTGDVGGSAVIRAHPDRLLLYELDPRELVDVDTRDALEKLKTI